MTNRTLVYLTSLVFLGMLALFALNVSSILTGNPDNQTYLKYNEVRGMAVSHHQMLYTLNFKQQNRIISILNRAVRLTEIKPGEKQPPHIDHLIIYQFNDQPDILLTPITYLDHQLIFSVPQWDPDNNFMELSNGELQQLFSQTYDP